MKKTEKIQFLRRIAASLLAAMYVFAMSGCADKGGRVTSETEEISYGIDVAKYQGIIDWQRVAASGVDFAMVRLGYRAQSDGQIVEDPTARYNMQEASKAGIALGAYFFSTAVSAEEAMEEAAWAAELVSQYSITYPIAYDCEGYDDPDSRQFGMSMTERTDNALEFLETIEHLGYEGMFYASRNEIQDDAAWEVSRIQENYKVWVAQYPHNPNPAAEVSTYTGTHQMWQYSMEGSISGIDQFVDLNIAYFSYDGIEPPKNKTAPQEVEPDLAAFMDFQAVSEQVTAKEETRLRDIPSQGDDSTVLFVLNNGEIAARVGISSSGWSKLMYNGFECYAVSSYLTTDLDASAESADPSDPDGDGIKTQFEAVNELVTAKEVVNLRKLPSIEHEDADVLFELYNGDIATRVGVSSNGWSKLIYNGVTCYGVTSYMTKVDAEFIEEQAVDSDVGMEFEAVLEQVTTTKALNLRTLPSTERSDSKVVVKLEAGEVLTRTGVNEELEWSRVMYQGQTLYCVSWYLTETG